MKHAGELDETGKIFRLSSTSRRTRIETCNEGGSEVRAPCLSSTSRRTRIETLSPVTLSPDLDWPFIDIQENKD